LFNSAMTLGRLMRPLMPKGIKRKIPEIKGKGLARSTDPYARPASTHDRKMLILEGCVQPGMLPNINSATARVLDALKIQLISAPNATCCGALRYHLNDQSGGLDNAKQNIDAWWPFVESGVEAIVMTASGCGVMVKDYGHLFANDASYAVKAKRISDLTKDISEILPVLQNELIQLIQYIPTTEKVKKLPLLMIPPWINKYYIFDLKAENSFVKWALNQGITVFIISWVNPDESHAEASLSDYVFDGSDEAIKQVREITGEEKINAFGYCAGGILLNSLMAYHTKLGANPIASAAVVATPIDFDKAGDLMVYICEEQLDKLEKYISKKGYLEANL